MEGSASAQTHIEDNSHAKAILLTDVRASSRFEWSDPPGMIFSLFPAYSVLYFCIFYRGELTRKVTDVTDEVEVEEMVVAFMSQITMGQYRPEMNLNY